MDDAPYPLIEEVASAITHGLGVVLSVGAGAVLITLAALFGDTWTVVGASVFVGSLVLLYSASTLYHAVPHAAAKARLQTFDHCAIYVLIAGTYTPFLLGLRGTWGWTLFGVIWTLAAGGIAYTAGTVFYLNQRLRFAHAIWHLFVLAGSVCHFAAVLSEVLRAA